MIFFRAIFREMRGAYAEAAIQRSLLKQAFLGSKKSPTEIAVKEFFY